MPPTLEVRALVKTFGNLTAVDRVSFAIPAGICFGLLGPNGAGKTTTIEVIERILAPTSGEILYRGAPRDAAFTEEIGIQFQQTALLSFLTVRETLDTFRNFYRVSEDPQELIRLCHLEDVRDKLNDRISGGQRQRLLLALALVNKPRLLFLDEPSTGLDPQARHNLWDIIERVKDQGRTVVLTTHYMEEAQRLCDDVAIMDRGRIVAQGSPGRLIARHCPGEIISLPERNFQHDLSGLPLDLRRRREWVEIQTRDINHTLQTLIDHQVELTDMTITSPNLENVFLNLTGRQLRA